MSLPITPMCEVLARWAYSEISSEVFGPLYDPLPGVRALRAKVEASVRFTNLSREDCGTLCLFFHFVRGEYFRPLLLGIGGFHVANWSKRQLAGLLVIPAVNPVNQFILFSSYAALPVDDTVSRGDARRATQSSSGDVRPTEEHPVTVGMTEGRLVLLDGYRRAIRFWHSSGADAQLTAYVPIPIAY
jgi:hypothetical protein